MQNWSCNIYKCDKKTSRKKVLDDRLKNSCFLQMSEQNFQLVDNLVHCFRDSQNFPFLQITEYGQKLRLDIKQEDKCSSYYEYFEKQNHILTGDLSSNYKQLQISDAFTNGKKLYYIKLVSDDDKLQVNQVKDEFGKEQHSFLNYSQIENPSSQRFLADEVCVLCKDKKNNCPLFRICNCDTLYHHRCLRDLFKDKTKIQYKNYGFKISINEFRCQTCHQRYECNLKSFWI